MNEDNSYVQILTYWMLNVFAGKFITVGWGKKETQFHGSEGKQAAQRKIQVSVHLQKCIFNKQTKRQSKQSKTA